MSSLVTLTVAAMVAAISFSAAEPPPPTPPTGPEVRTFAARTIVCNNDLGDADLMNGVIAASSEGDEIVFDGPCLVNKTVKLIGNRAYRGESRTGTQIVQADGANLDAVFASDSYVDNLPKTGLPISLRALTVDGNAENNPTAGDSIVIRSWQTIVEDIEINGSGRHGVRVTSLSANGSEISNTQVNGRIANMQINHSGGSGIKVEDPGNHVTDWQIENNYVAGTGENGVDLDNAAGYMIVKNHIYGVDGGVALRANRMYGTSIDNNYIEDFYTTGIVGTVQGGSTSSITNNRIMNLNDDVNGTYVLVTGNYAKVLVVVNSNSIRGNGAGIGLDYQLGTAETMEVVSTGNLVSDVTVPRQVGPGVVVSTGQLRAADAGL